MGSLVNPWNYGTKPKSYLLRNDNGVKYLDQSDKLPYNGEIGMINDAKWVDLNGTGSKSLVLAGEWMNVTILHLNDNLFEIQTIPESSGWWKTVAHMDYDGDGDQDLLLGNMGLNSKLKASQQCPVNLYLDDLDQNGKLDAIMTYSNDGQEYLFDSKEVLRKQIPSFGTNFSSNESFASASLELMFGKTLDGAEKLMAVELRSGIFLNQEKRFQFVPFPNIMQISFIRDFLIKDLTGDGTQDIISIGNLLSASMQQGMYAADRGSVLTGLPDSPEIIPNTITGISLNGDARRIKSLRFQGDDLLMVAVNNDSLRWFKRK